MDPAINYGPGETMERNEFKSFMVFMHELTTRWIN